MSSITPFTRARLEAPPCYPQRWPVGEPDWNVNDPTYRPHEFTAKVVLDNAEDKHDGNKWADVEKIPMSVLRKRKTFVDGQEDSLEDTHILMNSKRRRYCFPGGRTGIVGRGLLGRWGPNHAADPIVTRFNKSGELEVILVTRADTGTLAFPGGMVNPGETHTQTLLAEFTEEAAKPTGTVDRLFATCKRGVIYKGPVDDPRTTDEAWIETIAVHFHATEEIGDDLVLQTSDVTEVRHVAWYVVDGIDTMYASHKAWLEIVVKGMTKQIKKTRTKVTEKKKDLMA